YGCRPGNKTEFEYSANLTEEEFQERPIINWDGIIWVNRPLYLWIVQAVLAMISFTEAILLAYLGYKGNIWQQVLSFHFILEMMNTIPFALTLPFPPLQRPAPCNAKVTIGTLAAADDLVRDSSLPRLYKRAGHRHLNLFQATYFVVVTFSTVGYGDFVPDIWPSQLFMVIMIGVALVVLPTQFEQLAFTWMERQKLGGSYSSHRAQSEKHVVVCSTTLHADTIMDFLNEFYAHPLLQDYYVVLLSPMELDTTMRMILQVNFAPMVPQYVQIFRPENKLHVKFAEFVVCEDEFKYALLANNCTCPGASTLVTLLLHTSRGQEGQQSPEEWHRLYGKCSGNEIYHIVLGDSRFFGEYEGKSFTYASFHSHRKYGVALVGVRPSELPEFYEETILLNPGPRHIMKKSDTCYYMSITKEENSAFVVAEKQIDTRPAIPKDTTACSLLSHEKKSGDAEEGSAQPKKPDGSNDVQYNLPQVILQAPSSSTPNASPLRINQANTVSSANLIVASCECHGKFGEGTSTTDSRSCPRDSPGTESATDSHLPSILPVPDMVTSSLSIAANNHDEEVEVDESEDELDDDVPWRSPSEKIAIVKGFPPVSPFIGVSPTLCFLLKEKKPLCCLQLAQVCEHCAYRNAKEYQWQNKTIILAADYASNGIYNFIIPLRAHFRSKTSLNPIILLLERRPDIAFLDAISYFPLQPLLIYHYSCSLDDLLRAGITLAENVVVVNKELSNSAEEDSLADCNTIVAVQTMFKFFPSIKSITELSQSSNMRFMQFRAHDKYALHLSKMEKMKISKEDMWIRTYGRLYQKLCSTTCEIPIGIYRTQDTTMADASHHQEEGDSGESGRSARRGAGCLAGCYGERTPAYSTSLADEARDNHAQQIERAEIANLVRSRMESLNLTGIDYDDVSEKRNSLSYLVRPSPFSAQKTFERHNSRRKSNISFCSQALIQAQAGAASRRGSAIGSTFNQPRAPPLATTKANSLSLPDSPTIISDFRGRSNSLRVADDILLRRSNSLRQGLSGDGRRRKSSLEEIGISHFNSLLQHQQQQQNANAIKIALNGSIGLEVTPPEEPTDRLPGHSFPLTGYQVADALPSAMMSPALPPAAPTPDPQHLQGTIV
ncbi:Uncharacterized protein OBRU01_11412, partial [Operophtera brumata]